MLALKVAVTKNHVLESHKEVTHQIVKERFVILAIRFRLARPLVKLSVEISPCFQRCVNTVSYWRLVIVAIGSTGSTALI